MSLLFEEIDRDTAKERLYEVVKSLIGDVENDLEYVENDEQGFIETYFNDVKKSGRDYTVRIFEDSSIELIVGSEDSGEEEDDDISLGTCEWENRDLLGGVVEHIDIAVSGNNIDNDIKAELIEKLAVNNTVFIDVNLLESVDNVSELRVNGIHLGYILVSDLRTALVESVEDTRSVIESLNDDTSQVQLEVNSEEVLSVIDKLIDQDDIFKEE